MKSAFYRQFMYCPVHGPVSVAIIPQEDIPGT